MSLFAGLSAFPLTPTDPDGRLRADDLSRFLARLAAAGVSSIGLLGSTGGYAYLEPDTRREAVRVAADCVGGRVPVIVGVGALRTDTACRLARDARSAGADALLLAPMSYAPLTDREVFEHVAAVAVAGELPLCLYNNPATTRFTFGEALIAELARLPNVAAVKMPLPADGDVRGELARLRAGVPDGFVIGYSGDWGAADALLAGADSWFSVVAGLLPAPALALARAAQDGNHAETARLDAAFEPLWALFRRFGSFRVMFAIAGRLGLGEIEPPRPVLPLPENARREVEAALAHLAERTAHLED